MATVNGIEMKMARHLGEMCNVTHYNRAEFTVYLLVDGAVATMSRVCPVQVVLAVRPGYGSEEHLFDRTVERISSAVEGRLFASPAAVKRAIRGVRYRESLEYSVELTEGPHSLPVPAGLEAQAEAIRDRVAAREAARSRRADRKFVRTLIVRQRADGRYAVTTPDAPEGYGLWRCGDCVSISMPSPTYSTADEAAAALAAVQAHYE